MSQAPVDPAPEIAVRSPVVTRPLLIALVGVCLLVAAAVLWAVFGRAPQTVTGAGYLLPEGGYTELGTRITGIVHRILVAPGQHLRPGDPVAVVRRGRGTPLLVTARRAGQVVDVPARPGGLTGPGEPLVTIQPAGARLQAIGFLPAAAAELVDPGMAALISPVDAPRAQYGYIEGSVTAVGPAPITRQRLLTLLGDNAELADHFLSSGPVGEVTVELARAQTTSGYRWTIGSGPDHAVDAGTLAEVTVVVSDSSVISRIAQ